MRRWTHSDTRIWVGADNVDAGHVRARISDELDGKVDGGDRRVDADGGLGAGGLTMPGAG